MELVAAVDALCEALHVVPLDPEDEHWRWELYRRALEADESFDALRRCVVVEPVVQIAVGVVFALLETHAIGDLDEWIAGLPPWGVGLVVEKAADFELVRTLSSAEAVVDEEDVDRWSDWVQRRLSQGSCSETVLAALARTGRTRRVRNDARARTNAPLAGEQEGPD